MELKTKRKGWGKEEYIIPICNIPACQVLQEFLYRPGVQDYPVKLLIFVEYTSYTVNDFKILNNDHIYIEHLRSIKKNFKILQKRLRFQIFRVLLDFPENPKKEENYILIK